MEKQSVHDFTYAEKQEALSEAFQMMKERERLEGAQDLFNAISEMGDGKGRHGEDLKTLEWLIEQAERVRMMEEEKAFHKKFLFEVKASELKFRKENEKLRQALEYYADEENYRYQGGALTSTIESDGGYEARNALEQSKC